jgi:hypothetical protein
MLMSHLPTSLSPLFLPRTSAQDLKMNGEQSECNEAEIPGPMKTWANLLGRNLFDWLDQIHRGSSQLASEERKFEGRDQEVEAL